MIRWRIFVWDSTGTLKPIIGVDASVVSLDDFSVNGAGSCGEATFRARPDQIDINPRDIIQFQFHAGVQWITTYLGTVVTAGNPRSSRLETYRAVGLKQRAYEILSGKSLVFSNDVATQARELIQQDVGRLAISSVRLGNFPSLGFWGGFRAPHRTSLGENLDQLAELVGSFIVPPGETYTYSGVTFNPGDLVPATQWGVDASGHWFFLRPVGNPRTVNEADNDVVVDWKERTGEEVFDEAVLIYASELNGSPTVTMGNEVDPVIGALGPEPLARRVGSGDLASDRLYVLDGPADFMDNVATLTGNNRVSDVTNAFDENPNTFATFSASVDELEPPGYVHAEASAPYAIGSIVLLDFRLSSERMTEWIDGNDTNPAATIRLDLRHEGSPVQIRRQVIRYSFAPDEGQRVRMVLPVLLDSTLTDGAAAEDLPMRTGVRVQMSRNCLLYDLRIYIPNANQAERLGRVLAREVMSEGADVTYYGLVTGLSSVLDPSYSRARMSLTSLTGQTIPLPIERVQTSMTMEQGAVTTFFLGSPFSADEESQRIVLKRLAAAAANVPRMRR